ncbi:MAG: MliC family protein [Gemmatimonadota bacterium]
MTGPISSKVMIMKHARLAAGLTVCVIACGRAESPSPNEGEGAPDTVSAAGADTGTARPADAIDTESFSYGCGGEYRFVAQMENDGESVRLLLPDTTLTLPRVVSASGARYGAGPFVYWSQGEEARLETRRETFTDCVSDGGGPAWREAQAHGIRFRAVGQEPGWLLDLQADGRIDIEADYGETVYRFPPVDPETDAGVGRTVYRIETEIHRATILIEDEPCRDVMSGWPFEATVRMDLDGREYRGCGRWL